MKKILCFTLCVSFILLFSCAYKADYPNTYTTEYCYKNYVNANPNLLLTVDAKIAKNSVERSARSESYNPSGWYRFYGIKNIPIDKYLWQRHNLLLGISERLVRNKNYFKDPLFDYDAISAKMAWIGKENDISVAEIEVNAIKKVICDAIRSKNYSEYTETLKTIKREYTPEKTFFNIEPKTDTLYLGIEIIFEEYDDLFWMGTILADSEKYYVECFVESEKFINSQGIEDVEYKAVYIELPENISGIIAGIDTE